MGKSTINKVTNAIPLRYVTKLANAAREQLTRSAAGVDISTHCVSVVL